MKLSQRIFTFGILPALFFQAIGAYFYFLFSEASISQILYASTKVFIFVWPLFWLISARKQFPQWITRHKQSILWGFFSGLLICLVSAAVFLLWKDQLVPDLSGIQEKANNFGLTTPLRYLLFSLFLSLFHSLIEEYYWRWFVFKGLQIRLSWLPAAVLGSLAFAFHHYLVLSQFFPIGLTILFGTLVGLAGFFWCFLYKKTGSLLGPWISHALADLVVMGMGYLLLF